MRRRLYEAGGFAFGGVVIAGIGGQLIGAGYPGWGRFVVVLGFILIGIAFVDLLWGIGKWLGDKVAEQRDWKAAVSRIGYLEIQREGNKASLQVRRDVAKVGEWTNRMAAGITALGVKADDPLEVKIRRANRASYVVDRFSRALEYNTPRMGGRAAYTTALWLNLAQMIAFSDLPGWRTLLLAVLQQSETGMEHFRAMRVAIDNIGNPTHRLNVARTRATKAADSYVGVVEYMQNGIKQAVTIIDERLKSPPDQQPVGSQ